MAGNPYETERILAEYLLFHYGSEEEIFAGKPGPREALDFARRSVSELIDPDRLGKDASALDVGCAVGAASFELSRHCAEVRGIDFSRTFIQAAETLRVQGKLACRVVEEGARLKEFVAKVPPEARPKHVSFQWGDAMALPQLPPQDVVLAANLICRLPEPRKFLDRLPSLVKQAGQLLLTTPFTWLEEYTPRENWLGEDSFAALKEILEPHFELDAVKDLPFLIREHARKFQYGVPTGSRWIRR